MAFSHSSLQDISHAAKEMTLSASIEDKEKGKFSMIDQNLNGQLKDEDKCGTPVFSV